MLNVRQRQWVIIMAKSGVSIQVGKSGSDSRQWLRAQLNQDSAPKLNALGSQMVSSLKSATPSQTGTLASGWDYTVKKTDAGKELGVFNTAYPEIDGNLALLVDRGHGTKNGGYVKGKNYIRPAIKSAISSFNVESFTKQ